MPPETRLISLRCRCGLVQGHVDASITAGRAVCYCRDCQAYAKFLGQPAKILDPKGGTEILACVPRAVQLTSGTDRLACMALSETGLLRWYADCCRTPIGNTPRDRKTAYVGLVRTCLPAEEAALDHAFGPLKIALNTGSADGKVASSPVATAMGVVKIMRNVIGSRLSGRFRQNPFFDATSGLPISTPRSLSPTERTALDRPAS